MTTILYLLLSCSKPIYPKVVTDYIERPIAEVPSFQYHIHMGATQDGLLSLLEQTLPKEGSFKDNKHEYQFKRGEFLLDIKDDKIDLTAPISIHNIPVLGRADLNVRVQVHPFLTQEYKVVFQDLKIETELKGNSLKMLNWFVGIEKLLVSVIEEKVQKFDFSIRPIMNEHFEKHARSRNFDVGDAKGCIVYNIKRIEMDDTKYIGGIEQDMSITLAPSVTIPCAAQEDSTDLPILHHVSSVHTGPNRIMIPIAVTYDGLREAVGTIFEEGKFFFSKAHKDLYVTEPDIFTLEDSIIIKMQLKGKLRSVFSPKIDGAIYFKGTIGISDNVLSVHDIDTYAGTGEFLLKLATDIKKKSIIQELERALEIDITQLISEPKAQYSQRYPIKDLDGLGCVKSNIGKVAVEDIFLHKSYVRVYLSADASTDLYIPCM